MNIDTDELSYCSACNSPMDVTMLAPFTNVVCPECGEHTRIKTDLGTYILNKRVGAGGMSLVFRAMDKALGRQVAIKILNEEYSMDQQRIAQFEQEAKITASISHPHCVRMYTVGQAFRRFYIAMELVAGGSLEELMSSDGAVSEEKILPVAMQVNEGLDAAYQAGLIHRDIKPGNILFDPEGKVKIVDFGLALVTQGGAAKADEIWATPYYVSPETLDNLEEDFRSDMYALGATLYHALSGKPPFETETRSTTELKEIKRTLPTLASVAPWLCHETCAAVDKAMAFNPVDRFRSYDEMFRALELAENAILTGVSQPAGNNGLQSKQVSGASALRKWLVPGVVALGVFVIGGMVMMLKKPKNSNTSGNNEIVSTNSVDEEANQEIWVKIGKNYLKAQNLMKKGEYSAAGLQFAKLMDDKHVVEPTASLACLQSSIALLLDGRSWDARKMVNKMQLRERSKFQREDLDAAVSKRIQVGMERLTKLQPVQPSEMAEQSDQVGLILTFASALKNWEQGSWDEAMKLFEVVDGAKLNENTREFKYYKAIGSVYIDEYRRLKPLLQGFSPESLAEVEKYQSQVERIAKNIKTKGRARLHVRALKEQLARYEGQFRELLISDQKAKRVKEKKEASQNFSKLKHEVNELVQSRKFVDVIHTLKDKPQDGEERERWRKQMLYLASGAVNFSRSIERNTAGESFSFAGETMDGVSFSEILSSSPRGLTIVIEGEERSLEWSELTNETMLGLYSETQVEGVTVEEERARLEDAISFAWLVGERERAQLAAEMLISEGDAETFEQRWNWVIHFYDQNVK